MYKVLLVDDEPFILEGMQKVIDWEEYGLEIAGYASNGTEALHFLEQQRVSIVVTDIRMPRMDGLELIRQVKSKGWNIRFIILSGHGDFEYVKSAARLGIENYLLKPVNCDELASTLLHTIDNIDSDLNQQANLMESAQILRSNILNRWMNNSISPTELKERASMLSIDLDSGAYVVSVLRILPDGAAETEERDPACLSVLKICDTILKEENCGTSFCEPCGDVVLLFGGKQPGQLKTHIDSVLKRCIGAVNTSLGMNVLATTGSTETSFHTVHLSYDRAKGIQNFRLVAKPNNIIDFYQASIAKNDRQKGGDIDFAALRDFIARKQREEALGFIDKTINRVRELEDLTPYYIQNIAVEILMTVSSEMKLMRGKAELLHDGPDNPFNVVFQLKTIDELISLLKNVVCKNVDYMLLEDESLNPLIHKLLGYIERNYAKDLSLKTLSLTFNVNAAYLGQLFKKETGEIFSNYLNNIRVRKARELFLTTNLKANEVAVKVGYADANYFYRLFKKMTGVSASQYRDSWHG